MKLIKKTYLLTSLWFIPIIFLGSVFCFFMIKYIIYEETDEYLTYEMERLIEYHQKNKDLPEFTKIAEIIEGVKYDKPFLKDTFLLELKDNEMVPHRELFFSIQHNDKDFTIVLRHLMPGRDDILEGTIFIILGLIGFISFILIFMINHISSNIWSPFYKTLDILTKHKINKPLPVLPTSDIDEFITLNTTANNLLKKITTDYNRTKEFNENASHELQTHLSIIKMNTERLLSEIQEKNIYYEKLQIILNTSINLSRIQKSLLLLSKIGNMEYNNPARVNLKENITQTLGLFEEAINIRNIKVENKSENCFLLIDTGLVDILINNLIKNAIKHNIDNGHISITLNQSFLSIENSGKPYKGNPEQLLNRFKVVGESGNLGIGLSIVKEICELYHFKISYSISQHSVHIIKISFI